MDLDTLPSPRRYVGLQLLQASPPLGWIGVTSVVLLAYATDPSQAPPAGVAALLCSAPVVLIYAVPLLVIGLRTLSASRATARAVTAAHRALEAGDPDAAEALLVPMWDLPGTTPAHRVSALIALASCHLGRGDPDAARALLRHPTVAAWASHPLLFLRRSADAVVLTVSALALGDLEDAERALADARRFAQRTERPAIDALEVWLRTRAGDHTRAVQLGRGLDARLPARVFALGRIAAAMSADACGAPYDDLLDGVRLPRDRPRWVHAHWPELVAFADAHDALTPSYPPTDAT
jgi:hypothetical protein